MNIPAVWESGGSRFNFTNHHVILLYMEVYGLAKTTTNIIMSSLVLGTGKNVFSGIYFD